MNLMKEALRFICSCNFWRMVLFWNIALIFSYLQLLKKSIFGSKSSTSSCSKPNHSHTPVCVITGLLLGGLTWILLLGEFSRSKHYPCAMIYYSKLCILLFSHQLHRQLRHTDDSHHVSVLAADPGAVKTNMTFLYMYKSLRFVGGDEVPTEVAVKPTKPDQLQTITTTIHLKVS